MIFLLLLLPPIVLWLLFRIIMWVKVQKDALPKGAILPLSIRVWAYPTLIFGYVLDCIVNASYCALLFWELPEELTVSARVKRLCLEGTPRRQAIACFIRNRLLKPYDPSGGHD